MAGWTTGTCESNGIKVHYLRTGGNKPPVVLLHGLMLNGACWTPLARALENDYDVIMPDARGHGLTSAPDDGYCYDNLAADVAGLVDELGLDTPVLVGHSMGGMTATVFASRYPSQVRGLVLADPAFLSPRRQREVYQSDIADQHRKILNESREDFLAHMKIRHKRRSREVVELFAQARFQTSICAFEIFAPLSPDYVELVQNLALPSLLVTGDAGSVVSPELARELSERNHRLEVVQIAEAGHAVPYDQPERFSAAVRTFLHSTNLSYA